MEFLSATKLIQDSLCPYRRKHETFEDSDHLKFGKAVDAGVTAWRRGGNFAEEFAKVAGELNLPLSEDYLDRSNKCFKTLVDADTDWLKLNPENVICIQSDDGEAVYHGNRFFEVPVGKDWGLRGAMDYADRFGLDENGERVEDLYDFANIKKHVIRIIDWKTGWSDADDLQTTIYALTAWIKYEYLRQIYEEQGIETVVQTRFFYLDQGGKSPKRFWNKENLVSGFRYIQERVKIFRTRRDYPKQLNKLCYCCSLASKCEVYQQALAEVPKVAGIEKKTENLPLIVEQLEKITAIRKIAAKAEEELKAAQAELLLPLGRDGYVCGDRVYVATESTSSYDYDLPTIFSAVQNLIERPPFELMKFNSGAYDDLIKETKDAVIKKALKQLKIDHRKPVGESVKVTSRIHQFQEETEEDESIKDVTTTEWTGPKTEDAVIIAAPEASPIRGHYCAECFKITCDRDGVLEGCPSCGNPCLTTFENLKEAETYIATKDKNPTFLCVPCGCAGDFTGTAPGKCVFCGKVGPWRVVTNPMELKTVQRQLVSESAGKVSGASEAEAVEEA